jgi:hypothetical protein
VPANGGTQDTVSNPEAFQNPMASLLDSGQTSQASANPAGNVSQASNPAAAVPATGVNAGVNAANPNQLVQNLLNNPNPTGQQTTTQSSPSTPAASPTTANRPMGTIMGGGIAGVASKATGHSIKTVNDQSDYSLWEFYYDPSKDASRGLANAVAGMGAQAGTAAQTGQPAAGMQATQPATGPNNGTAGSNSDPNQPTNAPPLTIRMPGGIPSNNGIAPNPAPGTDNSEPLPTLPQ